MFIIFRAKVRLNAGRSEEKGVGLIAEAAKTMNITEKTNSITTKANSKTPFFRTFPYTP